MPKFDVTIAGELNLDLILYGLPTELPPEREMLATGMMLTLGSSSAIVAHNLAALGSRVGFQSIVGDDEHARFALERLKQGGVDTSRVRTAPAPAQTGLTIILQRDGWRNMLTYPGTIADLTLQSLDLDYLCDTRHFHFSSLYLQSGLRPQVAELFRRLKSSGVTISLDTNDDPEDRWEGLSEILPLVDIFLPNSREAQRIAGTNDTAKAVSALAEMVPLVVVKRGREGAIAQRGKDRVLCAAISLTPVDAVGAGDSFDAGFLHEYLRGSDLATCLRTGNIAGALSTTRPGGTEAFRDHTHREQFFAMHRS